MKNEDVKAKAVNDGEEKMKRQIQELLKEEDEQTNKRRLRECPFCGGQATMVLPDWRERYNSTGRVYCNGCGANIMASSTSLQKVIAEYLASKWNRRYGSKSEE